MKKIILGMALVAMTGAGCKKKNAESTGATPGSSAAMGSGAAMGSAMGSQMAGSGSAMGSAGSGSAAAAKPVTAEDVAKRFDECWGMWNAGKWDDFKKCYAADAVGEEPGMGTPPVNGADAVVAGTQMLRPAFPDLKGDTQLLLISGHDAISVVLITGTNSGPMKGPGGEMPATNKKVGLFMAQDLNFDDAGAVKHEWDFFDMATMMGQIKPQKDHPVRAAVDKLAMPKEVVIAKDDAKEHGNLDTAKKFVDAFNKKDAKAIGELTSDDTVWSEQAQPKDWNKKELTAMLGTMWKAFSDLKINTTDQIAAGDYVAATGTLEGTNDGPMPQMGIKKATGKKVSAPFLAVHKIENGKVKATWIFSQSMAFASQLGLMPAPGAAPAAGSAAGSAAGRAAKAPKK